MQTKLKFALCVANILINVTVIGGCIYEKQQYKTIVHKFNETKHEIKQQIENNPKEVEIETDKEVDIQAVMPVSLGEFKLTAYCSCVKCCGNWAYNRPNGIVYGAIGEELKEGYSIAVDPNVIPYGSEVIINGHTYIAHDTGGAIKGNRIDVYFDDHQEAWNFGTQYAEVYLVQN